MNNEEMYEGIRDTLHDALEEVIINIKTNNLEEFDVTNSKIDKISQKLDQLIEILTKLL